MSSSLAISAASSSDKMTTTITSTSTSITVKDTETATTIAETANLATSLMDESGGDGVGGGHSLSTETMLATQTITNTNINPNTNANANSNTSGNKSTNSLLTSVQSNQTNMAGQKLTNGGSMTRNGGFCGALQRAPPTMPSALARRLVNKENYGLGKVTQRAVAAI